MNYVTFRYALYSVVCLFSGVWCQILLPVIEPKGSGGFALHVVSLLIAAGSMIALVLDAVVCLSIPSLLSHGHRTTLTSLQLLALATLGFALVTLFNA